MWLQQDPSRLTTGRFLEDVAARHGDRLALRFEGRDWSYGGLEDESRRLARALLAAGVAKGARVAALFGNRPEFVQAFFAAGLVGAVLVPVNSFAAPDELDYVMRHGDVSILLLQASLLKHRYLDELIERHPDLARGAPGRLACAALPQLRRLVCLGRDEERGAVEGWEAFLARAAEVPDALLDAAAREVHPADDGLVIYTSGTTARPKGVIHLQRAAVIQSWRFAELLDITPDDRVWTAQPFFWTAGIAMSMGATLAAGASLHLQESFEPGAALACFEAERITTVHAWPHQEKALAEHPDAARRNLGSVRKLRATSPLAKLAGIEKDDWGPDAAYGLSETFTIVTALPASAPVERRRASHGAPLPGNVVRIVDPESGRELPRGEAGEIAVKGATLMRGYAKVEPELVFDAEGFFRTQDGGWLDASGELHWTGRLSNLIKTGGANVSPVEVEAALASHPELRAALAVGVPHPTLGEALVLCAVAREGARPDEAAIRGFLAGKLAAYKVPRRVLFFGADELAWTGSQKIQLGPLRDAALRRLERESAEIAGHRYADERVTGFHGGAAMQAETRPHPRFNHVALSVPGDLLDAHGRDEILRFHAEVFGWTEMPTLTRDRELLVLRAWSHEQFVFLAASDSPLRGDGTEHFGLSVATRGELDALWERAAKLAAADARIELTERKTDDFKVLQLHSFYVRFLLPLRIEVQCYEWAPGFDAQRMS